MTRDRTKGSFKGADWNDRLNTATNAKRAVLEKFKAGSAPDDPAAVERRAARMAASIAREARIAERNAARAARAAEVEAARVIEEARLEAEKRAQEAEDARLAEEERLAAAAREVEEAVKAEELKAKQKAARDLRYAKRKERG